jgi:hypothetical protein
VLRRVESRRFGGRSEGPALGARLLIYACAAAAAHGAIVLTLWPTTLGFSDAVGRGVGAWPHRPCTVDRWCFPNAMPYGGRNSCTCTITTAADLNFSTILIRPFIFGKSWQRNFYYSLNAVAPGVRPVGWLALREELQADDGGDEGDIGAARSAGAEVVRCCSRPPVRARPAGGNRPARLSSVMDRGMSMPFVVRAQWITLVDAQRVHGN